MKPDDVKRSLQVHQNNLVQVIEAMHKAGGNLALCMDMTVEDFLGVLATNDIHLTAEYKRRTL